jgi:flagellar biosynthesis GTPase FlhF
MSNAVDGVIAPVETPSTIEQHPITEAPATETTAARFTAEDLQKVREQEKNKLYSELEKTRQEAEALRKEKEEREAKDAERREARRQREAEAEAERKRKEEEEMDTRALLARKEQEFQDQLAAERAERERAFALLEKEREFQQLQQYKNQLIEANRENIVPELLDLVSGNTPDELQHSIAVLTEKSNKIFEAAAGVAQQSRQNLAGTRVTVPANGPLDINSDHQQINSPEGLRDLSMADYMKNRDRLLGQAASNRGQGLFG